MLFHHYRTKILDQTGESLSAKVERKIQGQWQRIIHEALYRGAIKTPDEIKQRHPYLSAWIPVILASPMTVNYNFDDCVQQLIQTDNYRNDGKVTAVRPYETVWNTNLPVRPKVAVLYHPNGFLPQNLLESPTHHVGDHLVFSEASFADQLIESMAGHHASLLHHFSKTTCLVCWPLSSRSYPTSSAPAKRYH
jgi:hypothetical protein